MPHLLREPRRAKIRLHLAVDGVGVVRANTHPRLATRAQRARVSLFRVTRRYSPPHGRRGRTIMKLHVLNRRRNGIPMRIPLIPLQTLVIRLGNRLLLAPRPALPIFPLKARVAHRHGDVHVVADRARQGLQLLGAQMRAPAIVGAMMAQSRRGAFNGQVANTRVVI